MERAVQERRISDYQMLQAAAYLQEEKQHLRRWYHQVYVPVENDSLEEWYNHVSKFRGINKLTSG